MTAHEPPPRTAVPQLIFSTAAFFARPLREAFRHVAEAGYTGVEVMVTKDPATQEAHLLDPLAREHGLTVEAIHAPFLLMTRRVFGADPVEKVYRSVHLAQEVGADLVVIHPPYRWQTRFRHWVDESLPEFSERTGVIVAVENMFPVRLRGERGVAFHAKQQVEDLERVHAAVLDTSHAAVAGLDLADTYRRLRGRLAHVHLSNNAGKGWDSHLPVDQGVLPIPAFLALLSADGFAGRVSLELDIRPYLVDERATQEVLVRNRELCESGLAPSA